MDIKELNKTQLILLTLLITFVVSVATGIITVSLMQQMPKSVPNTINNVIQRTIEKVSTAPATAPTTNSNKDTPASAAPAIGDGEAVVSIYSQDTPKTDTGVPGTATPTEAAKPLGDGVIISDVGLILVDSTILTDKNVYKVILNKTEFDATILKKFGNGFAILKISKKEDKPAEPANPLPASAATADPKVDKQ
jgi:hypothetical protein